MKISTMKFLSFKIWSAPYWPTFAFISFFACYFIHLTSREVQLFVLERRFNSACNLVESRMQIGDFRGAKELALSNLSEVKTIDLFEIEITSEDLTNKNIKRAEISRFVCQFVSVKSPKLEIGYKLHKISAMFSVLLFLIILFGSKWILARINSTKRAKKAILAREKSLSQVSDVLMQAAHDIRSPVAALQVYCKEIEGQGESRELIEFTTARIHNIAEDLLNFSKSTKYSFEPIQLIIDEIGGLIKEKEANSSIQFLVRLSDIKNKQSLLKLNLSNFLRAMSNIINNAIDATYLRLNPTIEILLRSSSSDLFIEIRDNGNGMPESILKNVGKRDFTFGKSKSLNSGNGLGLPFVFETFDKIGGCIEIQSKVNEGTLVQIRIPIFQG